MKLTEGFNLLATAPDGIKRLRELILSLAVQGKLVQQEANDEPACELLKQIRAEKDSLIAEGKIKKDKPLPAISDDEKPFEIPQSWEWVSLGMLYPEFQNGVSSRGDQDGAPITVLRLADIKSGEISLADTREIPIKSGDIEKYRLQVGDVLITRVNGSAELIGRFTINSTAADMIYCDHFIRMRLEQRLINPTYLRLLGDSELVRAKISGLFITTAGQKTVNQGHINSLLLSLPPVAEQSRIVAKVEELMALCDALETRGALESKQHTRLTATLFDALAASESAHQLQENWTRLAQSFDLILDRPAAVDALEQTLLQLAVRGLLVEQDPNDEPASELLNQIRTEKDRLIAEGKIKKDKPLPAISDDEKPFKLPDGWDWVRLGTLIELVSGQHLGPSEYKEGLESGIPYLTGPAEFGEVSPSPTRSTTERRAVAIAGDILITVKGSGVGKLNVTAHPEIAISRQLMAIRSIGTSSDYLMLVLQTMGAQFQAQSVGIAIPGIGRDDVMFALIGLAPLSEQSRIVARVEALRTLCTDLRQRLTASQKIQTHLAETLVEQAA